jgi:23S rRNA (pseudouridine1915-N3)-methyltransferase
MSIRILCLGKTKQDFIIEGINEYLKRLQPFHTVHIIELADISLNKSSGPEDVKWKEAEIINKSLKTGEFLIALDETGNQFSSVEFSTWISLQLGYKDLCFVIGGVFGLHKSIKEKANLILSFSKMTCTHQMIRLMLVEQLYRAFMIMKNKPYHY